MTEEKRLIKVVSYDKEWPLRYHEEVTRLRAHFKGLTIDFHHIGSTSIKNCSAKPIIDILGITADITQIDPYSQTMSQAGYDVLGEFGMKQRRYFSNPEIHLHIFEDTDPEALRHLRFAAFLNQNPEKVQEYSDLKKSLSLKHPHDIESYILGKEGFIKEIDIMAAQQKISPTTYRSLGDRKKKWTQQEIISALHVNMHLHMTLFSKYIPTMDLIFQPDVIVVRAEIEDDSFNYVLDAKFSSENVSKRIAAVGNFFDHPFAWWVSDREDTPNDLAEHLEANGHSFKEKDIGMFLELERDEIGTHDVRRVLDQEDLKAFTAVITEIGGSPEAYSTIYRHIPSVLYENGASLEFYLLYDQGIPVTTGIVLFHANVAGLYFIATKPSHRKQGFGTAMIHFLLQRAKARQYSIATLAASESGKSLYQRMGFKPCCSFLEFS